MRTRLIFIYFANVALKRSKFTSADGVFVQCIRLKEAKGSPWPAFVSSFQLKHFLKACQTFSQVALRRNLPFVST